MNKFIGEILNILKKDKRLFSKDDNKLLKGELISLISKDDEKLLELLSSNKEIEKRFFKKIGKITIFQKENFLQLITMNEFLPDSFTAFEISIGLSNNKKLMASQEDISLVFPHKDCILEGGQDKEDAKREEIFFNTTLAPDEVDRLKEPKVLTNWKKFDSKGERKIKEVSKNDNLVIKGNNLLALYSLLPSLRNKIKLIYIDPPYNTGNDTFGYNDKFNRSSWLTFMKNRLEIARELLSDNGSIAISIDHHENHSLKFILEEVFGADNFIQDVIVETSSPAGFKLVNPGPVKVTEYIIFYAKNKKTYLPTEKKLFVEDKTSEVYSEIITNPKEKYTNWKTTSFDKYVFKKLEVENLKELKKKYNDDLAKEIFNTTKREMAIEYADYLFTTYKPDNPSKALLEKAIESKKTPNSFIEYSSVNNSIYYLKNGRIVAFYKNKLKEVKNKLVPTKHLTNLWTDISWSGITNEGGVLLNKAKKPEAMLKRIIELSTNKDDLVMDFFAGSGTTGAVAHKMNRKYVLIEQMEYIHELPEKRLINVINGDETGVSKDVDWKGGGSFVYTELLEWNNKYIRELGSAKTKTDIKKIKARIEKEAFYKYQIDTTKFDNKEFDKLSEKEQREVLADVLDMNHLYVNIDSINDATFAVSKEDKELNKKFYNQK